MTSRVHRVGLAIFPMLLCAGLAGSAGAEESTECDEWFPDFQCEDRDGRYDGFVMPMQMPYLFEDPFITSGLNLVGIWHDYPNGSALGGGEIWVLALQARLAITDRLAFIATKDGFVFHRPNSPLLSNKEGFFDIAAGFKYALIDMPERNFILTPSFRIDIPVGQRKVFSGNGGGEAIPAVSAAWGVGDFHVIAQLGGRIPFKGDKESSQFFWNAHLDYALLPWLVPFFEVGGMHYTSSGDGSLGIDTSLGQLPLSTVQAALGTGPFEGADVANLGSQAISGADIYIGTFGVRAPIGEHVSLGVSYDVPFSERKDIYKQRVSMMLTYEF